MGKQAAGNVAPVYAEALYGVAQDANHLERAASELRAIRELFAQVPDLNRFFETPSISLGEKRKVVTDTFREFSPEIQNFLSLLIAKRRTGLIDRIEEAFHALANEKAGTAEVRLESARTLDSGEKEKLGRVLERMLGKKVVFRESESAGLSGGFVLTHGDRQWNISLAHRLRQAVRGMEESKTALNVWTES